MSGIMKVKIKTWEAMKKEFGLRISGNIKCKCTFTEEMEEKMPKDRVIEVIKNEDSERILIGTWKSYSISTDMIEEYEPTILVKDEIRYSNLRRK